MILTSVLIWFNSFKFKGQDMHEWIKHNTETEYSCIDIWMSIIKQNMAVMDKSVQAPPLVLE